MSGNAAIPLVLNGPTDMHTIDTHSKSTGYYNMGLQVSDVCGYVARHSTPLYLLYSPSSNCKQLQPLSVQFSPTIIF